VLLIYNQLIKKLLVSTITLLSNPDLIYKIIHEWD